MLHCFQCGADLPDNLVFCLHCGARLEDEAEIETVVNPAPVVVPEPGPNPQRSGSGIGKFILGSVLGGLLVVLLLIIGGFVLFSMKSDNNTVTNLPANNTNFPSPTPATSPSRSKPTPSPATSKTNDNASTNPSEPPGRECRVVNPAGGSVNIRRNCDTRDCTMDSSTLYTQANPGEIVIPTGRKPVSSGRFTWIQVRYGGELLWISSTRMNCN